MSRPPIVKAQKQETREKLFPGVSGCRVNLYQIFLQMVGKAPRGVVGGIGVTGLWHYPLKDISKFWLGIQSSAWNLQFKFPEKFLEISSKISLFSLFSLFSQFNHLIDLMTNPTFGTDALSFCICMAQCLASSQTFIQFIRLSPLPSYTSKTKTDSVFKYYLESNDQQRIECTASSFEVLGAIGTLTFSNSCTCI